MSNKLKCTQHDRRVLVVVYPHVHTIHRSDDTACSSDTLTIFDKTYTPEQVADGDTRRTAA